MKKILIVLGIVLLGLTMTNCEKEVVCDKQAFDHDWTPKFNAMVKDDMTNQEIYDCARIYIDNALAHRPECKECYDAEIRDLNRLLDQ